MEQQNPRNTDINQEIQVDFPNTRFSGDSMGNFVECCPSIDSIGISYYYLEEPLLSANLYWFTLRCDGIKLFIP